MLKLKDFSMGMGDRNGHQGKAQLAAIIRAKEQGVEIDPVWNKSNREHTIIGTKPEDVRAEADAAVKALGWKDSYYVDADHINLTTVDSFIGPSDFFTIDVADFIGGPVDNKDISDFVESCKQYIGPLVIPGIEEKIEVDERMIKEKVAPYLGAVRKAGEIYRHIKVIKGEGNFITEVSMDETKLPQTPIDMFFILKAFANEKIPAQTVAPKFTGRFNKGVDYVGPIPGDTSQFEKEFNDDLAVIDYAVANFVAENFRLPSNLKLSIHSGSDKFSIYGPINDSLKRRKKDGKYAGLHLKTAGTTWLEEMIGLAAAGGDGLKIAKEIYKQACKRIDELSALYSTVIDIKRGMLPNPETVKYWSNNRFAQALRHVQSNPNYDRNFRQLIHIAYKIPVEMDRQQNNIFTKALEKYAGIIAENVTTNLYDRHIVPLFIGGK